MVTVIGVTFGVLLLCVGTLLGAMATSRVLQSRLHQRANEQAEERRVLAKEWERIRERRHTCPQCTNPLSEPDNYFAPAVVRD